MTRSTLRHPLFPAWTGMIAFCALLMLSGCGAGKQYVRDQIRHLDDRISLELDAVEETALEAHDLAAFAVSMADAAQMTAEESPAGALRSDTILFPLSSHCLTDQAMESLDDLARTLGPAKAPYWIEITGHTDNLGPTAFNARLSTQRAKAVELYLHTEHRVPLHRMAALGAGALLPVAPNDLAAGRERNRRVVVEVLQ